MMLYVKLLRARKKLLRRNRMNKESLNTDKMLEYYRKLDVVNEKYKYLINGNYDMYVAFSNYERSKEFSELTKRFYRNLKLNLDMVYEDELISKNYILLYELFCEKIITQYINIDGIERLFSGKYADFEWEMHLGMNHSSNDMTYYRDHFIHQLKDAYMMDVLLMKFGFMDKVTTILKEKSNSKISAYTMKMLEQQMNIPRCIVLMKAVENADSVIEGDNWLKKHYLENIIRMSCYMAGVFHDIGYPAVRELKENRRIIEYIVESYHFDGGRYDFNKIMALLQNSLLFRVVSPSEIRRRIEGDEPDHGAVSALLFLLQFYENGAIHRLEPYKLCAVELAGLAIYNHTNTYASLESSEEKALKADYDRCVFSLNPITYLLRICDDLQEWGRIYFEISNKQNLIMCNKCCMPVIRRKPTGKKQFVFYECNCEQKAFEPIFYQNNFPNRRIYNVTVCDEMIIEKVEKNNEKYILINLKYRLDKLLQIAYLSPQYAEVRIKELNKLKGLFERQAQIGKVFVKYVMTSNIILLKALILKDFLYDKEEVCEIDKLFDLVSDTTQISNDDIERLINKIEKYCRINFEKEPFCKNKYLMGEFSKTQCVIKKSMYIYLFVIFLIRLGESLNVFSVKKDEELFVRLMDSYIEIFNTKYSDFIGDVPRRLLSDCAIQASRFYENYGGYPYYPENYYKAFQSDKKLSITNQVKLFTDCDKYVFPDKSHNNQIQMDAYSDLCLFRDILNEKGS